MKEFVFAVTFLTVFLALNVRAQIIEGVYNRMTSPMDKVEDSHEAYYANVTFPGDVEDAKSQDQRYEEATAAMNEVANRHIDVLTDYKPMINQKSKETSGN